MSIGPFCPRCNKDHVPKDCPGHVEKVHTDPAENLADELMSNGLGEKAIRLTLMAGYGIMERPIGSWSREGLLAAIRGHYPAVYVHCGNCGQCYQKYRDEDKHGHDVCKPPKRRRRK